MNLTQLASKPQLIKVVIDDESLIKEYGEAIEFWMYDRHDMDTFMKLAQLNEANSGAIADIVTDIVRDEKGKQILVDGNSLPFAVMVKVIETVVNNLGNSLQSTTAA